MSRIEVFRHPEDYALESPSWERDGEHYPPGWYYWYVEPGCLPDSDPIGPFPSQADAVAEWKREELERDAMADEYGPESD